MVTNIRRRNLERKLNIKEFPINQETRDFLRLNSDKFPYFKREFKNCDGEKAWYQRFSYRVYYKGDEELIKLVKDNYQKPLTRNEKLKAKRKQLLELVGERKEVVIPPNIYTKEEKKRIAKSGGKITMVKTVDVKELVPEYIDAKEQMAKRAQAYYNDIAPVPVVAPPKEEVKPAGQVFVGSPNAFWANSSPRGQFISTGEIVKDSVKKSGVF
jgi:hypothetical protein